MDELEFAVLELMLFPESFEHIVSETRIAASRPVIGDVLKKLLHDELVSPYFKDSEGNYQRSIGYDSDDMNSYYYQITAKGIDVLNSSFRSS